MPVALAALVGLYLRNLQLLCNLQSLLCLLNLRSLSRYRTETFTRIWGLRYLHWSISHIIQTEKSCGSDENSKKSPLLWLSAGRKLSKKRVFSILFMPSWLRNQRAYAGLVLIKHYNNLSYYRISLGAL